MNECRALSVKTPLCVRATDSLVPPVVFEATRHRCSGVIPRAGVGVW